MNELENKEPESKGQDNSGSSIKPVFAIGLAFVFLIFLLNSCSGGTADVRDDSADYSSYSEDSSDDYLSSSSSLSDDSYYDDSYDSSHSSSDNSSDYDGDYSSGTLLDEDDWVDTSDGKTYLKSEDSSGGTSYMDTEGEYFIHRNSDGTGSIVDSSGNMGTDTDGDGSIDSVSVDGGNSWIDMD